MSAVKGWCPGALRPMLSGDGLVVRLRLSGNEATAAQAKEIAGWSQAYGSGLIDLSGRGNLQLRGVTETSLPALTEKLTQAGLLDASAEAEAVHNVLVGPLTDVDPQAPFDPRPDAKALERVLANTPALWALPGKFGFSFDAGAFPLADGAADVAFVAVGSDAYVVALAQQAALGPLPRAAAVTVAVDIARAFLDLRRGPQPPRRMRDALSGAGLDYFAERVGLPAAAWETRPARARGDWLGAHIFENRRLSSPLPARGERETGAFLGLALPFGRIAAHDLAALADLAGDAPLRFSPWRAILIPGLTCNQAEALAKQAATLDLILDPADPRLAVAACPGAPACSSAFADTRAAALALAPGLAGRQGVALHVSGCAKGCAFPQAAPFAVVAQADGYALVRDGRADAPPFARALTLDALKAHLQPAFV